MNHLALDIQRHHHESVSVTRVSIESTDSKGKNWFTIGVSANIIDASFKALVDSLDYKLFKDNAPASL